MYCFPLTVTGAHSRFLLGCQALNCTRVEEAKPVFTRLFGEYGLLGHYVPHPDRRQEALFFGLLRECLASGAVSEDVLRQAMALNHVRHDALEVIERTPPLADQLAAA